MRAYLGGIPSAVCGTHPARKYPLGSLVRRVKGVSNWAEDTTDMILTTDRPTS